MAKAKMKIILPLVIWISSFTNHVQAQGGIGFGIRKEIFFLNLEDGYFGCQVNESTDVLQLYELSRICDGTPDCYRGSDELRRELKCTNDCHKKDGLRCQNGACLDSQCHCNDGFGGCSCEVPDENECKNRPCDVFAHCTNSLGSFHCTCFPGYQGDGFYCQDINECEDPTIAARCVENAECCNLPAHFVCKCLPGFEGDGEEECRDINECAQPGVCGHNALCHNVPGNYTCECLEGYAGNPFLGCEDINECEYEGACAPSAICTNVAGGHQCACPPGFDGDPVVSGCLDANECARDPCGRNALCSNVPGSFKCACPPGSIGDPMHSCTVLGCVSNEECSHQQACVNGNCQNPCNVANPCAPHHTCQVDNHNPVCVKVCECQHDADCRAGHRCDGCSCIPDSVDVGSCNCGPGIPCDPITGACLGPVKVICHINEDCGVTEACISGVCQPPCAVHNPCAQNAVCVNTNHGSDCSCAEGFHGNGFIGCLPVGDSRRPVCQYNEDCPPDKLCDRLNRVCINPCAEDSCGDNAECVPTNHGVSCSCLPGHNGNPYIECEQVTGCRSDRECPKTESCINGQCASPCRCGPNAVCDVVNHRASCKCPPGYTGNPASGCKAPQNPCDPNPCGYNALCEIDNGNPICFCPKGMTGNPFKNCIPEGDECTPNPCGPNSGCRFVNGGPQCFCLPEFEGNPPHKACDLPTHPCEPSPCGPNTQCAILSNGFAKCTCLPGYLESPNTIRGCVEKRNPCQPNPCGPGAICDPNRQPACFCPEPLVGNPYKLCAQPVKSLCQPGPCGPNADCYVTGNTEQCFCRPNYVGDGYSGCQLPPATPCLPNPCGSLALCSVTHEGHPMCTCPDGMAGDPIRGCGGHECRVDDECPLHLACMGYRCRDPCPGSCGVGASCRVEKHHPVCTCNHGLTGNPLVRCYPLQEPVPIGNPCIPSPCGPNTLCEIMGGRAVCSCLPDMAGDPHTGCRPECTLNSDCAPHMVCLNTRCVDPCALGNICGLGAMCTCREHMASCTCLEGFTGDPFLQCIPIQPVVVVGANTTLPCHPSPCDPHAVCNVYSPMVAMCDPCGAPGAAYSPACYPECLTNADCPFDKACLSGTCRDPCPGSCGVNAHCLVWHHNPMCACPVPLVGNPFEHCMPPAPDAVIEPHPCTQCGANAECHHNHGMITCACRAGMFGNPYVGCRPECVLNCDCPTKQACVNNRCVDPCRGACGVGAHCQAVNHMPVCYCPQDHTGDPFVNCYQHRPDYPVIGDMGHPGNPCDPSPCGPNSRCLITPQGAAACSCLPGYRGVPPICKPECVVSSECAQTQACVNQKCVDPCPGTCGLNAQCLVINHNPVCSCNQGYVGNPFTSCQLPPAAEEPKVPGNPCQPSPCGSNSICQVRQGRPVCSCSPNYIGSPPFCRPECVMSQECPHNKACIQEKCRNPCKQSCGQNAKCDVVNHTPFCSCLPGYQGDAFVGCSKIPQALPTPQDPCNPSPCGENAQCSSPDGLSARCTCIPPYVGNPYAGGCRPECVISADCPSHLACLVSHCRDPCPGVCGINAQCSVVNHVAICSCLPGFTGDPFSSCRQEVIAVEPPRNPCEPSPCGPNSQCRVLNSNAACTCVTGYIGTPPNCRPECVASSECPQNRACINQKCKDPCPGTCGLHARCQVVNHNPICSCPPKMAGDPFVRCVEETPRVPLKPVNPCMPSPCGSNAECRVVDKRPVCSCLVGMLGAPPNCRPECIIHADCPTKLACVQNKCRDPCAGSCGFNAQCTVVNHQPVCACNKGFQGDPFSGCNPTPVVECVAEAVLETPRDPCVPSPCGPNALCKPRHGAGSCVCALGYFGDPWAGCRPECVLNSDCPWDRACINNKCRDPCPGACGLNAECQVGHHMPVCFCLHGHTGNPLSSCRPIVIEYLPPLPTNPCIPSPCGPYSMCRPINNYPICTCQPGYFGVAPNCRPECVVSADCPQDKACVAQSCTNPCPGTCGVGAYCQVINHNAICSCPPGLVGDPFLHCFQEEKTPIVVESQDPCIPSPCGPNAVCRSIGNTPTCSCLPSYIGRPPNCRPECTNNAECPGHLACQNEKCRDPCPGSCGIHTNCIVIKHSPVCSCQEGFTGDPFNGCSVVQQVPPTEGPRDPCNPSPCGANAVCKERNGAGSCACLPEYFGDPYTGCRPECVINSDCDRSKACVNNKCRDPCPGTCGLNAECRVINHAPSCSCLPGYTGDPLSACRQPPPTPITPPRPKNPCVPSPCGPYSMCRAVNGHAVCSCQPDYIGSPPSCRPECMVSADCPQDRACIKQKCADPCPGTCGVNARCQVVNHNPICSCAAGFTGDPFVRCLKEQPVVQPPSGNPCVPSPCGPNSQCRVVANNPACSCLPNFVGRPPNCRPECTINAECPGNLACQNERCRDPCPGSCGARATCVVVNHAPQCSCEPGFTGDPFAGCTQILEIPPTEGPRDPCNPSPCGANAVCKERNGAGSCACLPEYFGDPYTGCRPECVTNSDCDRSKACVNNKCRDPCPGTCGLNAECRVINHAPSCSCLPGFTGEPMSACHQPPPAPEAPQDPCQPSPCGPYSVCRSVNGHAVCSCQANYIGAPPACRPECMVSADCPQDRACINQKCADPCPGTCGINARCQVVNHNPICSCAPGFTGDPFAQCARDQKPPTPAPPSGNPCVPSPCGPNSQCRVVANNPACSCLPNFVGRPPNCRPECTINAECPGNLACQNERCRDPCPGSCGTRATCVVVNHAPQCSCEPGFTGDPFAGCTPVQQIPPTEGPRDPCNPSPCGANAVCKERNGAGSCVCLPEYFGDPYTGCRPECVINSDCDRSKACVNNKCRDPCPGTCGLNAECRVINHAPSCSCLPGYSGDPLTNCVLTPTPTSPPQNPCQPSPCGPNSQCREVNGHAVCSCLAGFVGSPPACRPECMVSSDCAQDRACVRQKCIDPCPGTCGVNARCQVVNHNPICSCPPGFSGDPFARCNQIEITTTPRPVTNPCDPSPCGPFSQCRVVGQTPACSCLPNYVGQPPNCRPECTINAECPSNLACRNERCQDPCPGSCGQNAECRVVNHAAVCTCPQGFIGDPSSICQLAPPSTTERTPVIIDPCFPSPCGANAECTNRNGVGSCTCLAGFEGDPYSGCRRECETNPDCAPGLACIRYKCADPCPGTCGTGADCAVINHIPSCSCPPGFTGDPFMICRPAPQQPPPSTDPCLPSPCGPNSQCRAVNQQAVCSCQPNYVGSPPSCRPECVVSSECPLDRACVNQRCADPCPNTCGVRAQCTTKNHNPICACPPGFTGDPFTQCLPILAEPVTAPPAPVPSCIPSPCGPNSQCQMTGSTPACSCLPGYIGSPPQCRPECVLSAECPSQMACIKQRCRDPCPGSCGANANCRVVNHVPICTCNDGFTGDPFSQCSPIPITTPTPQAVDPCNPSPCGPNAVCRGQGMCECIPEYSGNPFEACRPECVLNPECPRDKACLRNKCRDPCPGTCGQNARCDVVNHIPVCSCPQGFTGDPFTSCRPLPPVQQEPVDPCQPSPCGPNSQCRVQDGHAVCSCLTGYSGAPPSCRPECIVSSECPQTRACVNQKCTDPCLGSCGLNARCEVINHSPICSCRGGQTGDPFRSCYDLPPPTPPPAIEQERDPCVPNPCGPNAQCQTNGRNPACSCLPNYVGAPPNCRPECVINPDCPSTQACINSKCRDPCPGSCGINAQCSVISHAVTCTCQTGFTGNPFVQCIPQQQEPINPCTPSPCGANAVCTERNGAGACSCITDYQGNPYEGCRPECVLSSDCPTDRACVRNKCQDPCPGVCAQNAQCTVVNHIPTCTCMQGYIGNPFVSCIVQQAPVTEATPVDPCNPSPCGPNSVCRNNNGQAVCSCAPEYIGSPPNCRPECVVNNECPSNRACYKYKCTDPCPGTCGIDAQCQVINHNPICSCRAGLTGDPFIRCTPIPVQPTPTTPNLPVDPCNPSPCGPFSECRPVGDSPSCSCRPNYIGSPPNCRPECVVNTDCPFTQACISEKCRDPCAGSCGLNADCRVQNHIPTCTCAAGYTGDPFTQCSVIPVVQEPVAADPCNPSPCGANAVCNNGACSCQPNYFGDPYTGCRPECTMNSDCPRNRACSNQRCVDPCPGTCGSGAMCDVINHIPTCTCPSGTSGDPFVACREVQQAPAPPVDPCNPSPCGPNSVCRVNGGVAVCSCQPSYIGSPPVCRPECVVSAECPLTQACLASKCRDPCPGTCGQNARCQVVNHNPICSCSVGNTGDPFRQCFPIPATPVPRPVTDPCRPSPCGPNSECQVRGESPACSCIPNYIGSPPNCRPECTINPECSSQLACINQRCSDPCPGSCGHNAQCSVINHTPVCSCTPGHTGDPFTGCTPVQAVPPPVATPTDPCFPSPCGANARCRVENSYAVCECLPEFQGNPYEGCRPECLVSSDCPMNKACINTKCRDPCPGTCGLSAICTVSNHIPICSCPSGYTGDAFRVCSLVPLREEPSNPCVPSPCGPNTVCRVSNGVAVCECIAGFQGSPMTSGCRPECVISADCPRNRACVNNKCVDPCPGVCGYRAVCNVINHSPVCSCPPPLLGDPFTECKESPPPPQDPCNPSPCSRNGQCRVINGIASCVYPECIINQDCPRDKACYNQKCRDPCVDACGINAICQVVNHNAVCSCPPGYVGEPRQQCSVRIEQAPKPECVSDSECTNDKACINEMCKDPCREPNTCAVNAKCHVQLHRPLCVCHDGMTGNAHIQCYEIGCRSDTECPEMQACVNRECVSPCSFTQCGVNAECRVDGGHRARCYCLPQYSGDPLLRCDRPQCLTDDECPGHLACRDQRCQDPCDCAPSAQCNVINHRPTCRCPPGYIGNPHQSCNLAPQEIQPQCRMDADCASRLACFGGECRNPCHETKPCGANAECTVVDSLPLRTMSCMCLPGYVGDADVECRLAPAEEPGCKSDDECPITDTCINRRCVNPCAATNPCAANAVCEATNHKAVCKCPPGFVGNAFVNCYREPQQAPECTSDSECPNNRACVNQRCQDPCVVNNPCGLNAECTASQHRAVCNCPQGWAGNPQGQCYKPECKVDSDCLYDKACVSGTCVSPCLSLSCGRGAECKLTSPHHATCVCPAGTQGNPMVSCVSVQCHYNEDCADHEACDRLNRVCRPVCEDDTCADTAHCTARQHQPMCSCPPGTEGNPYIECHTQDHRTPIKAECESDADCPSKQACINRQCADPCRASHMCSPDQTCLVQDTLPLRTVYCQCPPDTVADFDGRCKHIATPMPQCRVDSDCQNSERCVRGSCVEACHVDPCGLNALCTSQFHTAVCSCPSGFIGNPHLECTFVPVVMPPVFLPECTRDDECPWDRSCVNQRCINPCVADHCSRGAFCHVENHKPVCRCPAGFQGDPLVECRPPAEATVGCTSNSECSLKESCINRLCISPCNCGPNAECRVTNHYAICFCQPGYSGNPQIGCVKLGCESDDQCSNNKMCYNGECINPCILGDPCVANAECYGADHRASCRCLSGYEGNPLLRCARVECRIDADCPQDRACVNQHCVNPCDNPLNPPCAANALCYVRNHFASCRCPDHLPMGNPMAYCERRPPIAAEPECRHDPECPSQMACIRDSCVNPCIALSPCATSSRCSVLDTMPVRTMICTCPDGWVPNNEGECRPVVVPTPPGCTTDSDCPTNEACINRMCRNPCNCGTNTNCFVQNHRPICSCMEGFEGNPNVACRAVGCRTDSECESNKACVNSVCLSPCIVSDPCGVNAECYTVGRRAECRCYSGYRGNPWDRCHVVGCRSNSDCPDDRACINGQCISPCVYEHPCASQAECLVHNHLALCRCPQGMVGNPYTTCRPEIIAECKSDGDCPSVLACFNGKCKEPCGELSPCSRPSTCQATSSLPVRTMICVCPDGFISSGSGTCKPVQVSDVGGCSADSECPLDKACLNGLCRDPCRCGPNAECRVRDHKPVCSCLPGYDGNPELNCIRTECRSDSDCSGTHSCVNRMCVPACAADGSSCGTGAVCYGAHHRAVCQCQPGLSGDANVACVVVGCQADAECPTDRACINSQCISPCAQSNPCQAPAECVVYDHKPDCSCPPGFVGDLSRGCQRVEVVCTTDSDCPSQTACINSQCVNPCDATAPCGVNTRCQVFDTPVWRTMVCECLPGYQGNAAVRCDLMPECAFDKGYVVDEAGNCVCPPGTALNPSDECVRCLPERGQRIDERGRCVCALERGMIIDEHGNCVCPTEFGYRLDVTGNCVPSAPPPECESNDDCPDHRYCNLGTKTCEDPCLTKRCGINALCNATRHQAVCQCIFDYSGDPEVVCNTTSHLRTDFPRPDMVVSCLSDGVQVEIHITEKGFNGVLYVKGHSKDEQCRRVVTLPSDSPPRTEMFKVTFGTCGLIHVNGQASFVLVIQKHPKLVTYKAQAYHIKCVYTTGEQNVTLGFNVSMLTTAGTIANTGPPPTCSMRIVTHTGQEINSAEIGDNLMLEVNVQPSSIYGGFARSCVAKTMEDSVENEYIVTDENGCATDPSIFGEWDYDPQTQSLLAGFNAFKFPSSDNIRFQCNIRVCFGKCQPVNCRGYNAFGRRRRSLGKQNNTAVDVAETFNEGQLREEITIQSNAILTFERREERYTSPTEAPDIQEVEDICVSMIGFIIALIMTALLALVAVAVAVSCWLIAYRRRPKVTGPLPHPPEFPNPLFTTPEPVAEPSPDYLS